MIARPEVLKFALASVFVAAGALQAQVYDVGSGAQKPADSQPAAGQKAEQQQSLGFGSNIENARLARGAELALQRGDKVQALDYARRAAQASPSNPQLWFLVGYAARLNSRFQESADYYSRGLRLSPGSLEGQSGLAQTYSQMGRNDEAEKLLKQVIASDPRRKDDAILLGDLYMRAGDYQGALEWLNKGERAGPGARSELLLAISYQHLNQMDEANRYLEMARKRDPNNPDVERSLAGYYRATGNYKQAIEALKTIKSPKPDVVAELAYTYQLSGDLDDASRLYAQAADALPKDMGLQLSAAQADIAAGSIDKADVFLKRATTIDANYYRLHAIRGEIAKIQEDDKTAAKEYGLAITNLPAAPAEGTLYGIQLHVDLMGVYKDMADDAGAHHELETAENQINALADQQGSTAPYLRLRAEIRLSSGELDGALADINKALAVDAHDRTNLQLDGDILMKLGHVDEAINTYKKILDGDPNNRFALVSLGYASRVAGRDEDAEMYFQRLEKADPTYYVPYLALGDLYTARHDYGKAQASYSAGYGLDQRRALIMAGGMNAAIEAHQLDLAATWLGRVKPEMEQDPQILREKERYLSFKGDYQASAAVAQQAIKVLPHDRDVVVYYGYDLLHLEKYDELLSLTTQYGDSFPKEPDIPLLQGYVDKHNGDEDAALKDFTETLKRDPEVVTAYVNRGYTLNDLHQPAPAADDFEAALKREPDNGEAHLGLAYSSLDLHRPQVALKQADLAEKSFGDIRDIHVIRATAYGRMDMLTKAATEYRLALKFTPDDGALHLGLGNTLFAERHYHDAVDELKIADKDAPNNAQVQALLARSYANMQDKEQTMHFVQVAEQTALAEPKPKNGGRSDLSDIYIATGEALMAVGEQNAAMDRFRKALTATDADRVGVRLAIAELMAQQGHSEDAERQIALAQMEGAAGESQPPTGTQYIAAADVFRSMHDYQLSQTYLERARTAGAPDAEVRIGMADSYLALGDTTRAEAELNAVRATSADAPTYQLLLAEASVQQQEHHSAQALTSFAQAANAEGEDQTAEQSLLSAGADEGLRVTPKLSLLSFFSVDPIFEDTTVYVLDAKLDSATPIPPTSISQLPPPRSSIETEWTDAFHLHLGKAPTIGGFFQLRNARGQISVPATNTIVNRDTTDYTFNVGISPTLNIHRNAITFNGGIQEIVRRDSKSPAAMNQNLFRQFGYVSTSSFFNVLSFSGYITHETGPFTDSPSPLSSSAHSEALDFRVGAPWGKTALVTGWGSNDQKFSPTAYEDYVTASYIGLEHKFGTRLTVKGIAEDLRAWRTVTIVSTPPGSGSTVNSGLAQSLRPAGNVDFAPNHSWDFQVSSAYSNNRSFHAYDAVQNGFSVSYARPFKRKFNDESGQVVLQYPIRFSAGIEQESFFDFTSGKNEQFRPYFRISLF